jgi:DNA-binding PadR family transcriptional regulator
MQISAYDVGVVKEFVRGAVPVHVLHHAAEGGVHGAWMAAELARHGYQISPGSLYPLLHRMEHAGLLVSHEEVVDGRLRRVYEATAAGEQELGRLRQAVAELAGEVLDGSWRSPDRTRPSRPVRG